MTIINTQIKGGGTTPTGTLGINTNGVHNVANYEYADVQVPSAAPAHYIDFVVTNGVLTAGSNLSNYSDVTSLGSDLSYIYRNNAAVTGTIDFRNLTTLTNNAFYYAFANSGLTGANFSSLTATTSQDGSAFMYAFQGCTNLTSIDFSNLETVDGYGVFNNAFSGCTSLTSIDLGKLKTISGNNSCASMFYNCSNITTVDLSSLQTISGSTSYMFSSCSSLGSIDLSSLTTITGSASYMFQNCTSLTSADFSSATTIKQCNYMFSGCTNLTDVDLSSIHTINGTCQRMFSGCSSLTSMDLGSLYEITGNSYCQYMFENCTSLTSVDLSGLKSIIVTGTSAANSPVRYMFEGCTNLQSVDMSGIKIIGGLAALYEFLKGRANLTTFNLGSLEEISNSNSCYAMCYNCPRLTTVDLSKLIMISGSNGLNDAFDSCSALTTMRFDSLRECSGSQALNRTFWWAGVKDIYFPAMISDIQFNTQTLLNTNNVNLHFPSNKASVVAAMTGYPDFGGSNVTILYDLPATVYLTGANSTQYERNPKYDTATALAWRVKDTDRPSYSTVDWTPYYTSGTTDPVVGDTIYSDAACTVSVTTIDSIS